MLKKSVPVGELRYGMIDKSLEDETVEVFACQGGAWQKDNGLRIDHLLLSPQAADRLTAAGIDRAERGKTEPSDHVPVWCELNVAA